MPTFPALRFSHRLPIEVVVRSFYVERHWGRSLPKERSVGQVRSVGNMDPLQKKKDGKAAKERLRKKKKKTALVVCHNGAQYWTTQSQFWQWVRELKIVKIDDFPLTGRFNRPYEELMVLVGNTVLNLAHRNHLREAVASWRYKKQKGSR